MTIPTPLDPYENALVQLLKRSTTHTLADVLAIWGWRNATDPSHIDVADVARCLWTVCEKLDLLGHSFSSFPGGLGGFGVMCDAAPGREWALLLSYTPDADASDEHLYWYHIVSVLCSRLYMAEVAKLPGYDHHATVGPFGARFANLDQGL